MRNVRAIAIVDNLHRDLAVSSTNVELCHLITMSNVDILIAKFVTVATIMMLSLDDRVFSSEHISDTHFKTVKSFPIEGGDVGVTGGGARSSIHKLTNDRKWLVSRLTSGPIDIGGHSLKVDGVVERIDTGLRKDAVGREQAEGLGQGGTSKVQGTFRGSCIFACIDQNDNGTIQWNRGGQRSIHHNTISSILIAEHDCFRCEFEKRRRRRCEG